MEDTLLAKQFLTFRMDELFAVNVGHVLEVLEYSKITKLPNTPVFMSGVINNRGMVVPVINLRKKFGMEEVDIDSDTCFIIIEIKDEGESINVGLLVDSVQEVITLEDDQVEPPPKIGMPLDTQYINGIGKVDEDFVIILNIEKILSAEEILMIRESESKNSGDDAKSKSKKSKKEKEVQEVG